MIKLSHINISIRKSSANQVRLCIHFYEQICHKITNLFSLLPQSLFINFFLNQNINISLNIIHNPYYYRARIEIVRFQKLFKPETLEIKKHWQRNIYVIHRIREARDNHRCLLQGCLFLGLVAGVGEILVPRGCNVPCS